MKVEALEIFKNHNSEEAKYEWSKLNGGQREVVIAYVYMDHSSDSLVDLLVLNRIWSHDIADAINYMKSLNIKSFVFADSSTECYKSIQILLNYGCKLSTINYKTERFIDKDTLVPGILVEL